MSGNITGTCVFGTAVKVFIKSVLSERKFKEYVQKMY